MKYLTLAYVLAIVGISLLATLGLSPWNSVLRVVPWGDKVCHFVLMGGLSFLLNRWLSGMSWYGERMLVSNVTVILLVLVTVDEFSQILLPSRTFSLLDLACNYGGVICFGVLAVLTDPRRNRRFAP